MKCMRHSKSKGGKTEGVGKIKEINKTQSQEQKKKTKLTTHAHYVKLIKLLESYKLVESNLKPKVGR